MSYTQEQIDELRAALATGARSFKHGERETIYRTRDEMVAQLATMEASVNSGSQPLRRGYFTYGKGR